MFLAAEIVTPLTVQYGCSFGPATPTLGLSPLGLMRFRVSCGPCVASWPGQAPLEVWAHGGSATPSNTSRGDLPL
eukprot:5487786-Pyramimonas_sp.AAC.1